MKSTLNILLAVIIIILVLYIYNFYLNQDGRSIKKIIENYYNINNNLTKYVVLVHTGGNSESYINLTKVRLYNSNNQLLQQSELQVEANSEFDASAFPTQNLIRYDINSNSDNYWTSFAHTNLQKQKTTTPNFNFGNQPYFLIKLNNPTHILKFQIENRKNCCQNRANGIRVIFYNEVQEELYKTLLTPSSGTDYFFGGLSDYNGINQRFLTKEITPQYEQLLGNIKKNWTDQGCWRDFGPNAERVIKIREGPPDNVTWKTLNESQCFLEAEQNGANIVGMQAGYACFYGNTNVAPNNLRLPNGDLYYKKFGQYTGNCPAMGVDGVNRVWTLKSSSGDQTPGWSDQGCWSYNNIPSMFSSATQNSLNECFLYANNNNFKIIGIQKSVSGSGYKIFYPVSSNLNNFEFYKTGTKMNNCNVNETLENTNIINIWINSDKIVESINNSIYNKLNTKLINLSPSSVAIDYSIDNLNKLENSIPNMNNIYSNVSREYNKFNSTYNKTHIPLQVINAMLTNNKTLLPSDSSNLSENFEDNSYNSDKLDESNDSAATNKNLEKFIDFKPLKMSDFEKNNDKSNWENKWAKQITDSGYFIK